MKGTSKWGLVGLGVMGKSLALNFASHQIALSVYNRHVPKKEEQVAQKFLEAHPNLNKVLGFENLQDFVNSLTRPRAILLMVNAGNAVDAVIDDLMPLLDTGDLIMDGGNSHYTDTARRAIKLKEKGIDYLGIGISGGEEGARKGPSLMPGGAKAAYERVKHDLDAIAAKDMKGHPCSTYIGDEGSGHFVKMVHNGIEYAEMQILAECYQLLRFHNGEDPDAIASIFDSWKQEGLNSYLLEITIAILQKKEGDQFVIDMILDVARQKGTGGWSTHAALELGTPLSTIAEAVMARHLSAMKTVRVAAAQQYENVMDTGVQVDVKQLKAAYQASRIINHAIGFDLISHASATYVWHLNRSEIARVWTNGCIIRSALMETLISIFKETDVHLLLHPTIVATLKNYKTDFTATMARGLESGCAIPVMSAALNYFNGIVSKQSTANMIQAQRDYFGAHTYQRIDRPEHEFFHTIWTI